MNNNPSAQMKNFIKDIVLKGEYDNDPKCLDEIISDMFNPEFNSPDEIDEDL